MESLTAVTSHDLFLGAEDELDLQLERGLFPLLALDLPTTPPFDGRPFAFLRVDLGLRRGLDVLDLQMILVSDRMLEKYTTLIKAVILFYSRVVLKY